MKNHFSKELFWDIDYAKLDKTKHAKFIIERVLSFGGLNDLAQLQKFYTARKIKNITRKICFVDKKSHNFWAFYYNLPKKRLKCTPRLSMAKHSAFWQR